MADFRYSFSGLIVSVFLLIFLILDRLVSSVGRFG